MNLTMTVSEALQAYCVGSVNQGDVSVGKNRYQWGFSPNQPVASIQQNSQVHS